MNARCLQQMKAKSVERRLLWLFFTTLIYALLLLTMELLASNSNGQETNKKQFHCFSSPQLFDFHFNWTIEHFSLISKAQIKEIKSTTFIAGGFKCFLTLNVNYVQYNLIKIVRNGYYTSDYECQPPTSAYHISLSLNIDCTDQSYASSCVSLQAKCCIINKNGLKSNECDMPMKTNTKSSPSFTSDIFLGSLDISNETKCILWNDDSLKIQCEFKGITQIKTTALNVGTNSENQILDNFGHLLEAEKFSDVTLRVDGKELKAHKAILAAQSPVFEAMFQHSMKENISGSIDIKDIDFDVMQDILRYMYSGKVADVSSMTGLLVAADKYGLNELKMVCSANLVENVSLETCVSLLLLADNYSAKDLKEYTLKYVNANIKIIMQTADWKAMTTSHPHLGFEFLQL